MRLEFTGSQGTPLAARLDVAPATSGRDIPYALFAHCFTCGKDVVAAARIARALTERGFAVLRFDFTGLGGSGGDFGNTDFSSNIEDLILASDHLRDHYAPPSLLIGHSLGGAAVLAAAHRIPETRAVVTIGAPADPAHVHHLFGDAELTELERDGTAPVTLGGRAFRIRREFLADIAAQPQAERIATLHTPLLVLHSPTDQTVGVDNARRIFDTARHPKSFVALDGADHLLTRPVDAEYVASMVATWASRYLPAGPVSGQVLERTAADTAAAAVEFSERGTVVVTENGPGSGTQPYGQRITAGPHLLSADEPEPVGTDSGPNPYDLLLASLGACTSMTIRMYAERKSIPLDGVSVRLRHSRIHASDCAECDTKVGLLDHIERVVALDGELSADQRERLMAIADKCPVHRTLHSEIVINTVEATPDRGDIH
ncbi:MAG TPA: bifunctional alpha/beta hydrolase/OsmC family protein [Pseudonocardia sp.]|nr:bifunctional alpha/beta hydrolase/OsmC family protein [Pseudonocardia sp.]